MGWGAYEQMLHNTGYSFKERQLCQAREDFYRQAVNNPACQAAKRNGIEQQFLITRTEVPEKYKIVAFPDEDLDVGDYIDVFGERFLVIQSRVQDTLQKNGIMWLCNHKFRWQSFNDTIVERWAVLDSGVYSSTIRGEVMARTVDKQFKLYLPEDSETRKLFIDKRLAAETMCDKDGNTILNVYQITGYDATSESFGANGHLLVCNLRSDEYNRNTDNVTELICDYIENNGGSDGVLPVCSITGKESIRLGTTRKYTPTFYTVSGNEQTGIVPLWSFEGIPTHVTTSETNGVLAVNVPDNTELLGKSFNIVLNNDSLSYAQSKITVNIVGL